MSVNRVILIGNLGADPEVKTSNRGTTYAHLSVATSERYSDGAGQRQEKTEWHRVVCFGKTAEFVQQYLTKGRKIYVEGKIQTSSWEDERTREKRYRTEIIARDVVFLDKAQQSSYGEQYASTPPATKSTYAASTPQTREPNRVAGESAGRAPQQQKLYTDDDIPF